VIAQDFFLNPEHRRTDRIGLVEDIDAITVVIDHPQQSPDLALDAPQAGSDRFLRLGLHLDTIPMKGIFINLQAATKFPLMTRAETSGNGSDPCLHHNPTGDQHRTIGGTKAEPANVAQRLEHATQTFHSCGAEPSANGAAARSKYLKAEAVPLPHARGGIYTCPMHPEVRQAQAGVCPICGMVLEPLRVLDDEGPSAELVDMTRRFWLGLGLAIPVVILAMGGHVSGLNLEYYLPPTLNLKLQFLLTTPIVFWSGWPFLVRGWLSVRNRSLNMFSLIALGVGAAYVDSLAANFAPHLFPANLREGVVVPVYYEATAVIIVLVLLGQILELRARAKTGGAIRALLDLAPKTAHRLGDDGYDEEVPLDRVQIGDRLRIRPGDSIPVDGVVLEGRSAVDESVMTGEAMPVEKEPDAMVIGGTINGSGSLIMRAQRIGSDTMLAHIVEMVAEAQRSRAPIQRLADIVSAWFVPVVILVAIVTFVAWTIWGPPPAFASASVAAVSVVIIACPCALGLATPMSIMVGVGKGARAGILIKNAEALERFERIDTLVVDKTGTLTEGKPQVVAVVAVRGFDEATVLALGASLERSSEHPLAAAIVAAAQRRALRMQEVAAFTSDTGKGVTGKIGDRHVAVGNAKLMSELGVSTAEFETRADELRHEGATAIYIAVNLRLAGLIAVADPIKPTTQAALTSLRADGIRIIMVTGDNRITAQAVAIKLGIREIEADVLPVQKNGVVRRLRREGRIVAMAGDGVNDAPALAEADVGIAIGTRTDVAMQTAGITLVRGDLAGIARARALSRAIMNNIRQNLALAFVYNVLGIPLAAGALYPFFGILLSPVVAAAAMSLSSVSVIGNSLRLWSARL
jgi:P-type Cu+ transporter